MRITSKAIRRLGRLSQRGRSTLISLTGFGEESENQIMDTRDTLPRRSNESADHLPVLRGFEGIW